MKLWASRDMHDLRIGSLSPPPFSHSPLREVVHSSPHHQVLVVWYISMKWCSCRYERNTIRASMLASCGTPRQIDEKRWSARLWARFRTRDSKAQVSWGRAMFDTKTETSKSTCIFERCMRCGENYTQGASHCLNPAKKCVASSLLAIKIYVKSNRPWKKLG